MSFPFTRVSEFKNCHFPLVNWLLIPVISGGGSSHITKICTRQKLVLESEIWLSFLLLCRAENEPTLNLSNGIALVVNYQHYMR